MKFASLFPTLESDCEACAHFPTWDKDFFCQMLDAAFPETGHYTQGAQTFLEKVSQFNLIFDLAKPPLEQQSDNLLDKICEEQTERTREDNIQAIKLFNKKLPSDGVVNWRGKMQQVCSLFDGVSTSQSLLTMISNIVELIF
jgi:hypothetical protein